MLQHITQSSKKKQLLLTVLTSFMLTFGCKPDQNVDTIVYNGIVYTVNDRFETVTAFAVKDGKIIETGRDDEMLKKYTAAETIDAKGQAVYPGFIDAHAHFIGYGQSLFMVDLFNAQSWDDVVARVIKFAKDHPGEKVIKGRGWDQNKWPGKSYPDNEKLNRSFPTTPVILTRVDGHAAIVNQKMIGIAGLRPGEKISGGEIETKNGKLTG